MTPESKAMQLLDLFSFNNTYNQDQSKKNALMCVYEIIDYLNDEKQDSAYWQEVRMFLIYMGTGELEAKADRFNLND
jgi:hypothetical protein